MKEKLVALAMLLAAVVLGVLALISWKLVVLVTFVAVVAVIVIVMIKTTPPPSGPSY